VRLAVDWSNRKREGTGVLQRNEREGECYLPSICITPLPDDSKRGKNPKIMLEYRTEARTKGLGGEVPLCILDCLIRRNGAMMGDEKGRGWRRD